MLGGRPAAAVLLLDAPDGLERSLEILVHPTPKDVPMVLVCRGIWRFTPKTTLCGKWETKGNAGEGQPICM